MAGILPDEGENLVANQVFKNITTDRGTDLELVLYTNTTIDDTITEATLTQPYATAGGFNNGDEYVIVTVGTTDFTLIGAASNTVGLKFTTTGVGAGTGTASPIATLTDASWTVTADTAAYALQAFTVGVGDYTGSVYGYAILTTGTTPRIIAIEVDTSGPYTLIDTNVYNVTPNVTVS